MHDKVNNDNTPYVAVWMLTYNHEKYIAQAIEGVLNQKADFKIKLFIGEDCSKDNTRNICLSYEEKYPDKVKLISTRVNNINTNSENIRLACMESGAKYIAICEGDDYWTDPYKTQKQVTLLDAHPECTMSFSAVASVNDEADLVDNVSWPEIRKNIITIEDIILSHKHLVPSVTLIFRNILPKQMPQFHIESLSKDVSVVTMLAMEGNAAYLPDVTAVYRVHRGGITKSEQHIRESDIALTKLLNSINKHYDYKHDKIFRKRFLHDAKIALIFGARDKNGIEKIRHYFKKMPAYLKYSDKLDLKEMAYYHGILFFPAILKLFKKPGDEL